MRWAFAIILLLVGAGCERSSPPKPSPPPSPIDALFRSFKPGHPIGVGPQTFTAGKIVRVDEFTLEYDDVMATAVDSKGQVSSLHARSLILRFIHPDEFDMTWHHAEWRGPGGQTMTSETESFGPYKISDWKKNGVKENTGGPEVQPTVRVSLWDCQSEPLGSSGYIAQVGAVYPEDSKNVPSHYSIDVEKADGNGSKVYFRRDFRIADVPAGILNMKISQIVSYDERSRTVTFQVGNRREGYRLEP